MSGMRCRAWLRMASFFTSAEANLVSVRPGSRALQRMPNCAHSLANTLVMLITAALVTE
ncbi:hypothetical protein FQZ97_1277690 [compost metagenome]